MLHRCRPGFLCTAFSASWVRVLSTFSGDPGTAHPGRPTGRRTGRAEVESMTGPRQQISRAAWAELMRTRRERETGGRRESERLGIGGWLGVDSRAFVDLFFLKKVPEFLGVGICVCFCGVAFVWPRLQRVFAQIIEGE